MELQRAEAISRQFEAVDHQLLKINLFGGSALTGDMKVPKQRNESEIASSIPVTYVPARNTLFLSYCLVFAEVKGIGDVFLGVNAVDYSGYPDCRPEFFDKMGESLGYGSKLWTEYHVPLQIEIPIIEMSKADIVKLGVELKAPLELTWSCYQGGEEPCRRCDSCILRANGFRDAGYPDPALHA